MTTYSLLKTPSDVSIDNRCRKYLAPCVGRLGKDAVKHLLEINVLAFGLIDDFVNTVFVVSKKYKKNKYATIEFPIGDFIFGHLHVSGYPVDERAYTNFIKSRYSLMYEPEEVSGLLGSSLRHVLIGQVLIKDEVEVNTIATRYNVPESKITELDGKIKYSEEFIELSNLEKELYVFSHESYKGVENCF